MQVTCKIVFDSEDEKINFIKDACPFDVQYDEDYGYMDAVIRVCEVHDCPKCWAESGIKMEVKTNDEM